MKFKIPFTFSNTEVLKKRSKNLAKFIRIKKDSKLDKYLQNADCGLSRSEYIAICLRTFFIVFIFLSIIFSSVLFFLNVNSFYLYGLGGGLLISLFMIFNQLNYPKTYSSKKTRDIEKNLISAMQDMLVQMNSGVPVFKILLNIASSDYGSVSYEFRKAVREINSGKPQVEAIDDLGNRTTSVYFRRILWQISNGMRAGSDMAIVIKEGIDNLTKEQVIQIQSYGNKLNPLVMFYMLFTVIMPALGLTFLTIISSMMNLPANVVQMMFIAIFVFVTLLQVMFLGIIKTRRPSLL